MRSIYQQSDSPPGYRCQAGNIELNSRQVKLMCGFLLIITSLFTADTYATSSTPRVKQVETYLSHACALFRTGQVSCWGVGAGLGNGLLDNQASPVPVAAINDPSSRLTGVKELASGGAAAFTCALMKSRHVACWGTNAVGQLGNINTTEVDASDRPVSTTPVLVRDISGSGYLSGVRQVVVGINYACALLRNGRVACWGSNQRGILGSDKDNETFFVGSNSIPFSSLPLLVKDTSGSGVLSGVRELSSSIFHACAILRNRQVACWGSNGVDELGAPTENTFSSTPVIAHPNDPALKRVKQIATLAAATCALSVKGAVSCWGNNSSGGLGNGTTIDSVTPVAVKPIGGGDGRLTGVKRLRSGGVAVCAELRRKKVACWGSNGAGMLGNGSTDNSTVPVEPLGIDGIGKLRNIGQIKPGSGSATCALQKGNQVLCWGSNRSGQLGNGTNERSLFPVRVIDLQ